MTGIVVLPTLMAPDDRLAVRVVDRVLSYWDLTVAARVVAAAVAPANRVAILATPSLETVVGVVGAVLAGVPVVPLNPHAGERELAHILADADPDLVLHAADAELAPALRARPTLTVDPSAAYQGAWPELDNAGAEDPAFVLYTSGTTGPPKGVVLPRRAVTSNLDALARAWAWTADDVVAHALPLFHVHGLILGVLGPLRLGGAVHHLGRFASSTVAQALRGQATMLFGVPTMYHRLAEQASEDASLAAALGGARLLVSGSAALAVSDHERIAVHTGQLVVERYGMTETLMSCAVRTGQHRRAGVVGPPVDGVSVRLLDDDGRTIAADDHDSMGEIVVRGPNLFTGYLNNPAATSMVMRDGWFHTGDLATRDPDGSLRIVGRRATDLIKSGGYKIGAGEIENVLLEHPGVSEVAVTGAPDPDLGERVVAWVVPTATARLSAEELVDLVARQLAPHKRPREVHFLERLPRNDMGKVTKRALGIRSG